VRSGFPRSLPGPSRAKAEDAGCAGRQSPRGGRESPDRQMLGEARLRPEGLPRLWRDAVAGRWRARSATAPFRASSPRRLATAGTGVVYQESSGDEIGELVEVFNQMVKDLRHNIAELEKVNSEKAGWSGSRPSARWQRPWPTRPRTSELDPHGCLLPSEELPGGDPCRVPLDHRAGGDTPERADERVPGIFKALPRSKSCPATLTPSSGPRWI